MFLCQECGEQTPSIYCSDECAIISTDKLRSRMQNLVDRMKMKHAKIIEVVDYKIK